jgi:hypothetical protein
MTDSARPETWLGAVAGMMQASGVEPARFTSEGLGAAIARSTADGRAVVFRRRLVSMEEARRTGVEWTFRPDGDDAAGPAVTIREPLMPRADRVAAIFKLVRGWLSQGWDLGRVRSEASGDAAFVPPIPADSDRTEYWLSTDRQLGFVLCGDGWSIRSAGRSICTWVSKQDGSVAGQSLSLESLDALCLWLVRNWHAIAFGDVRPVRMRERSALASRAYEDVRAFAGGGVTPK